MRRRVEPTTGGRYAIGDVAGASSSRALDQGVSNETSMVASKSSGNSRVVVSAGEGASYETSSRLVGGVKAGWARGGGSDRERRGRPRAVLRRGAAANGASGTG